MRTLKVFMPANEGQLREGKKEEWFSSDICKKFIERGGELGWELKGPIDVEGVRTRSYGVHLSYNVVRTWSRLDSRHGVELIIDRIANQSRLPDYVVFHGMEIGNGEKPFSDDRRFTSTVGTEEYHYAFAQTVKFAKELKKAMPSVMVVIENTPLTDYFQTGKEWPTMGTHLCLRSGSWSYDLIAITETAKCGAVLDLEHLSFARDFLRRREPYNNLEAKLPMDISLEEAELINDGGPLLREGMVPIFPVFPGDTFEEEIARIGAHIFHVSGSSLSGKWQEICNGKIACHSPIHLGDENVREALATIKKTRPNGDFTFVLEVENSPQNPEIWTARSPNAQKESLEIFCQMLLDIWYP
jgi:hypothetical protein